MVQVFIPRFRYEVTYMIHSAEKLHEYGIEFQPSNSKGLTDISFNRGKLKLPSITVDGNSEITFLNMIAFERVHVGAGNEVTSYVSLMGTIIRSAKDVNLLITSNIIVNALGSEKSVADLFEGIFREVKPDPGSDVLEIFEEVHAYSKRKWNVWLANLKDNMVNNYFKNPWTFLTFLAATFVILLAVAQTIYTILSYYKPEKK
ncbi:hypothetical protein FRX31_016216 [Thalictrum thalictroides]|uniref:Uncharacterized protein n=1 Tax=Thalictrum thalictroides TaxID=46969 RepID=A0A7J6WB62_THATH|nr:hypothetical protein FRX31_016216 [Thalictrum thalictroides]